MISIKSHSQVVRDIKRKEVQVEQDSRRLGSEGK